MEHTSTLSPAATGHVSTGSILKTIAAPFVAIGTYLVDLGERHPRAIAINKLSAQSDTQLAAKGLTREDEIRRILGGAFY